MNTSIIGYVFAIANLQHLIGNVGVSIASIDTLLSELKTYPEFPIEGFRKNGFVRVKDMSIYMSRNVREYVFNQKGKAEDEGILIKVYYKEPTEPPSDDVLAYFFHKGEISEELNKKVLEYIDNGKQNRKRFIKGTKIN